MAILEKNRPQVTSKSSNNAVADKSATHSKPTEKPKKKEKEQQEKAVSSRKPDEGVKKSKTSTSKTAVAKVDVFNDIINLLWFDLRYCFFSRKIN